MDKSAVAEFIDSKFKGSQLEELGEGHHSQAYKFETQQGVRVLRISPKQDHFLRDSFVAKTWPQLPTPKIIETGAWEGGGYFAVSEYAAGDVFASDWTFNAKINLEDVRESYLRSLIEVSNADVSATSGYGKILKGGRGQFNSWRDFLLAAFEDNTGANKKIRAQIARDQYDEQLLIGAESATRQLLGQSGPYETRHLIHGDFQPHNVIIKEGKVEAVLDWGSAKYGDFTYDIMWMVMHGPEVVALSEIKSAYQQAGLDLIHFDARLKLAEISILISWAMFSNEIGNHDNAQNDQARLRELLAGI